MNIYIVFIEIFYNAKIYINRYAIVGVFTFLVNEINVATVMPLKFLNTIGGYCLWLDFYS